VALLNPLVKKMRGNVHLGVFLDAVNMASIALIVAMCYFMGRESIVDWRTIAIAVISLAAVFGFKKINSAWIVLGGSLLGALLIRF
jgi:chromate transporter